MPTQITLSFGESKNKLAANILVVSSVEAERIEWIGAVVKCVEAEANARAEIALKECFGHQVVGAVRAARSPQEMSVLCVAGGVCLHCWLEDAWNGVQKLGSYSGVRKGGVGSLLPKAQRAAEVTVAW